MIAMRALGVLLVVAAVLAGCGGDGDSGSTATSTATTAGSSAAANVCPQIVDWSSADFFPIQPSFSAGYQMFLQKNESSTQDVGYVLEGDFPYANWMAWYVYTGAGFPVAKLSGADITPQDGATNPNVDGEPILAPERGYRVQFLPATTPKDVQSELEDAGENVVLLPALKGQPNGSSTASIVGRSYWALEGYDRSGYGGPTDTPFPELRAYEIGSDGKLTDEPASCESRVPKRLQFDTQTGEGAITFSKAPKRSNESVLRDRPDQVLFTGGEIGRQKAPRPNPDQVAFYRNPVVAAPYADVQSVPGYGDPPDACGGYVLANLRDDRVNLVRVPQVPTYANYAGATSETLNNSDEVDVQFYSFVVYGAAKQVSAVGSPENSQIGNTQIKQDADGGATVMVWPRSAPEDVQEKLFAYARERGWNILKGGIETAAAPNTMIIREKGQNSSWKNAISANPATPGAPCPQTTDPSIEMPDNPPSAAVTQQNGMGLTAPQGAACTAKEVLNGSCLARVRKVIADSGGAFSAPAG
jgi:hypothetical protein